MRVESLSTITSGRLMVIDIDAPLQVAAVSLSNPGIGLVVVRDKHGRATGVLSKSDLIRHLTQDDPAETSIMALMSREIISCDPADEIHAVWETMVSRRLQNIPVLEGGGKPLGILDIRDAMKVLFEQEELQEHMLSNYIAGIGYQ